MTEDLELERLMLDILTIAGSVQYEEPAKASHRVRAFAQRILHERQTAINDKLEEVALELKKLEEGVYTTAQTPAGLVRAMKVR